MKITLKRLALAIVGASLLTLYGCGGGGGGGGASGGGGGAGTTLSGVAATGAAYEGAIITVTDRSGATVGTSSAVGADGAFSITLSAGATPPFVLKATRTSADGAVDALVSVVPSITGTTATVNITPVTHLIASRLALGSGDPLKLAAEVAANPDLANDTAVQSKVSEVQTILAPILTATGTTDTNPLSGSFTVDGTGYDRLLDSCKITIVPSSPTSVNIEVAVKQKLDEGVSPNAVQFTNATSVTDITPIPTVDPTTLVAPGTATLISQHLAQLNACFALPVTERVDNPNPSGAAVAAATSSNIIAPACRNAFFQDGAGAIQYLSNGDRIGAVTDKPFRGLFFNGATGLVFSQGSYEFTRTNGDIVIGFKNRTASGAETFGTMALRKDGDVLKQIGNQYAYPGRVAAYHQDRQFLTLNQGAFDYYSTGYNLHVDHVTGGAGVDGSIFDRVVVTTPRGNTLVLKPQAGSSTLVLVKAPGTVNEAQTRTIFVRLRSEFKSVNNTTDPALKDPELFFADRDFYTNDVIAKIPAQSLWRYDYYLAGNTGTTPDATQHYKTRARALTINELKLQPLARLDATTLASIRDNASTISGTVPIGGDTSIDIQYIVDAGALPPTSLQIWGRYDSGTGPISGAFTDSASVASNVRTGAILCSKSGPADAHCTGASGTPYVASAIVNGAHLWARDPAGREFAAFGAMYPLAP